MCLTVDFRIWVLLNIAKEGGDVSVRYWGAECDMIQPSKRDHNYHSYANGNNFRTSTMRKGSEQFEFSSRSAKES